MAYSDFATGERAARTRHSLNSCARERMLEVISRQGLRGVRVAFARRKPNETAANRAHSG